MTSISQLVVADFKKRPIVYSVGRFFAPFRITAFLFGRIENEKAKVHHQVLIGGQ